MMNQQSQNLFSQQPQMDSKFQYTDEELILRFQEGDEQAYIELVKRYKDKLINFVYRLVSDRDQAEDIIQDTMLKLYTHKHYYKNIAKFSTWIYTIAGNFAKTELRKKKQERLQTIVSLDLKIEITILPQAMLALKSLLKETSLTERYTKPLTIFPSILEL